MKNPKQETNPLFEQMKSGILSIDPVAFCETYLTLDGQPFRINGNGYKPFSDIYRYIGIKALEKDAKPVVIVKGRQVGATTMAAALELFFTCSSLFGKNNRPPMRIMHCFPLLEIGYRYTKQKLNTMIRSATPDNNAAKKLGKSKTYIENKIDKTSSANDSISFKQFENGNCVLIESTGLTADRLRSITCDVILYDEVQDIPGAALSNSSKSLTKAQYGPDGMGVQVYFGTPKQKGTDFHKIWLASSMQYFHLGCESCQKTFPLYTPESDDWMKIWVEDDLPPKHISHGFIVKCPHCGHQSDKRDAAELGKWIPLNDNPNAKYIGFHLNQLYMPTLNRDYVINQRPENHPYNTERAYQNEVMGEFFSGQSFLITAEEIKEKCGDLDRKFSSRIDVSKNKLVFAGFDWGEKVDPDATVIGEKDNLTRRGQSFSSCVVLTMEGAGLLSVEYAKLLKSNDPSYKRMFIQTILNQFSVHLCVSDIGHAEDLTKEMAMEYGPRFLASRAAGGNIKNHVKYIDDITPKELIFDRNYQIDQLIQLLKKGMIRIPLGSYEQVGWFISQLSSMETKIQMSSFGNAEIRYVKGSIPNDGFMALLNAYLAYQFYITSGFTQNNPQNFRDDPKKKNQIPAVLGHVPMGINRLKR